MNVSEVVRTTVSVRREDAEWAEQNGRKLSVLLSEYIAKLRAETNPAAAMKILDREQEALDVRRREIQALITRAQALMEQEKKLTATITALVNEYPSLSAPPRQVIAAIWTRINEENESTYQWGQLCRQYPTNEKRAERIRAGWTEARTLAALSAATKSTGNTGGGA